VHCANLALSATLSLGVLASCHEVDPMGVVFRRSVAVALASLVAAGWPAGSALGQVQYVRPGAPCPPGYKAAGTTTAPGFDGQVQQCVYTPPSNSSEHGSGIAPWLIGGGIAAGLAYALSHAGHAKAAQPQPQPPKVQAHAPSVQDLLENGPQTLDFRPIDSFPIYGLIANGWPIVLEYSTVSDAETELAVTVGGHTWKRTLPRGATRITVPYEGGDASNLSAALITVHAVAPGAAGDKPPRIEVYGIGAGDRAAGEVAMERQGSVPRGPAGADRWLSYARGPEPQPRALVGNQCPAPRPDEIARGLLAISDLQFGPATLRGGAEEASFSYVRLQSFEKIAADILHYELTWDGTAKEWVENSKRVWGYRPPSVQQRGPSERVSWNGRGPNSNVSVGEHRLQVRGWETDTDAGWAVAISQQTVDVR
jgi:hypothetical protein